MVKVVMLIFFIGVFIYNYSLGKKNVISIRKKPIVIFVVACLAIFGGYLSFRYDGSIIGYSIVLFAVLTTATFAFCQGITNQGINIFLGTTPILRFVKFNEIKNIELIDEDSNLIKVRIHTYGNTYSQTYRNSDKISITKLLHR